MPFFRYATFTVLLAVLGLAACSSNKVVEPEPAKLPDLPEAAVKWQKQWSVSVGSGLDGEYLRLRPAVASDTIYAASRDGVLLAVDRESGKLRWKQKTGLALTGGVGAGYGMVLAATGKGEVVAFKAEDGSQLWRSALSAAVLSVPALDAGVVVAQSADGKVYGLKREDGSRLWVHDTSVPVLSLRGGASPLLTQGAVFVGTAGGKVEAIEAESGIMAWEVRVATNQGRSELERMVDVNGDLLLEGKTLYSLGFQSQLTAVDVESGRKLWQYDLSGFQDLAGGLGNVYAVDAGSTLFAVDAASGKAVWKQPDLAWRGLSGPVVSGSYLLVGDNKGYVHVLAQTDGRVLGRFRPDSSPVEALLAEQGTVYVYGVKGRLSAWRLRQD